MKQQGDTAYLNHILEAITRIQEYVEGVAEKAFRENALLQDAVIRRLEIIGEATKQLSLKVRDDHPEVPWRDIGGMRDKLIHEYFGVDLDAVWETVQNDLDPLREVVQALLDSE